MKHYLILTAALALISCQADTVQTPTAQDLPAKESVYNAALAQSLGADDYGMRQYVMVILKTGPKDALISDEAERAEIFAGHFENIRNLAASKELVLAGPFSDPDKIKRGLYIFNVKTVEEAEALVLSDPAVKAGIFTAEFTPY